MRSILVIMFLIIILIPYSNAFATKHSQQNYTYKLESSTYTNQHAINESIKYWKQYGFNLVQTNKDPQVKILFSKYTGYLDLGYYSKEQKLIVVGTQDCNGSCTEKQITLITIHELGHFLGFAHYSDPCVMKPYLDESCKIP